jgi:hypothetical protein
MRNVSNKSRRERKIFYFQQPFSYKRAVCEIKRKNIMEPEATDHTNTTHASERCITKATDTTSEHVIRDFPRQQGFRESASMYNVYTSTYIASLVS